MTRVQNQIPVIDLFAGPGGLGEGFNAFSAGGFNPFKIALSIEKDDAAHQTLRLRSFFRQFARFEVPDIYYQVLRREVPVAQLGEKLKETSLEWFRKWEIASAEAMKAELGSGNPPHSEISRRIGDAIGGKKRPWILIGGPPCQAYSVVGRVRNRGKADYRIEDDHRSSLYEEYLKIIAEHRPLAFVMENVKGMLSAEVHERRIFDKILSDLRSPPGASGPPLRYHIVPLASKSQSLIPDEVRPSDLIVESERFGVPQQRHRVILVGLRDDISTNFLPQLTPSPAPTVKEMVDALPRLRSGISRSRQANEYKMLEDGPEEWIGTIREWTVRDGNERRWLQTLARGTDTQVYERIIDAISKLRCPKNDRGSEFIPTEKPPAAPQSLSRWLTDPRIGGVCNHSTRAHLDSDLARYLFAACHTEVFGESPRLHRFPADLQPSHANAAMKVFNDRFRVQKADSPSTTVISHLSKDGHYFIHYDPTQCRSMTVREAARLQTFPDNYLFCGNRTSQYIQVGNAVPPWLAHQIAGCVWKVLEASGRAG